jgi:hypothetical protein
VVGRKGIMKTHSRFTLICIILLVCGVVLYLVYPVAIDIYTSLRNYNQRISEQLDYTKITTPLPRSTVDDICSKFDIGSNDARCQPDSIVYGPDFFKDIASYLYDLSKQESALNVVQDKLGTYLVRCGIPDNDGIHSCRYDLRGDGIYPIFIYFNKEGRIYRIIANTSGS